MMRELLSVGMRTVISNGEWHPIAAPVQRPRVAPVVETKSVTVSKTTAPAYGPMPSAPSSTHATPPSAQAEPSAQALVTSRPGCVAADDVLVVKGHLEGLIEGKRGWPILSKDSPVRLREAARGAELMGEPEAALALRRLADKLPDVRDVPAAQEALDELMPLRDATWEMARRCGGGSLSPELMGKVQQLAADVKSGKITKEEAIARLKSEGQVPA